MVLFFFFFLKPCLMETNEFRLRQEFSFPCDLSLFIAANTLFWFRRNIHFFLVLHSPPMVRGAYRSMVQTPLVQAFFFPRYPPKVSSRVQSKPKPIAFPLPHESYFISPKIQYSADFIECVYKINNSYRTHFECRNRTKPDNIIIS